MKKKYGYDVKIKVGDIVTSYYKGYWRVMSLSERDGSNPLVYLEKVLNVNGTISKKESRCCDAHYCKRMTEEVINQIYTQGVAEFETLKNNLLSAIV